MYSGILYTVQCIAAYCTVYTVQCPSFKFLHFIFDVLIEIVSLLIIITQIYDGTTSNVFSLSPLPKKNEG